MEWGMMYFGLIIICLYARNILQSLNITRQNFGISLKYDYRLKRFFQEGSMYYLYMNIQNNSRWLRRQIKNRWSNNNIVDMHISGMHLGMHSTVQCCKKKNCEDHKQFLIAETEHVFVYAEICHAFLEP